MALVLISLVLLLLTYVVASAKVVGNVGVVGVGVVIGVAAVVIGVAAVVFVEDVALHARYMVYTGACNTKYRVVSIYFSSRHKHTK